jgi:hypothetical protein
VVCSEDGKHLAREKSSQVAAVAYLRGSRQRFLNHE